LKMMVNPQQLSCEGALFAASELFEVYTYTIISRFQS